jgi:stage V sporulation protein AD
LFSRRQGTSTVVFEEMPFILSVGSVVGPREGMGPLGPLFDLVYDNTLAGETSWEKGESRMLRQALELSLAKARLTDTDIDFLLAGDLLNQIVSSTFMARNHHIPFIGLYGACATMALGFCLASMLVEGGFARRAAVASSSHHDTAERQYRYPAEYGSQRVPTSQWTVTGAGAAVVSREGPGPRIEAITVGRVQDLGITDANDMGSAMAPAFADTVWRHLSDTARRPEDYDLILSGDLGRVGSQVARHLLQGKSIDLVGVHQDAGLLIYGDDPDICSGASGCGCFASVFAAKTWPELVSGKIKRVLAVATGALHSPTTCQQGESIPSVAHAVSIVGNVNGK